MCARTNARLGSSASAYRSETTRPIGRVVPVEERSAYVAIAGLAVEPGQRRVPVVAGEHLVGALAGLDHLDRTWLTRSLSRSKATTSWLTIGSAIAPMACPSAPASSSEPTRMRWWSVPKCSAMTSE